MRFVLTLGFVLFLTPAFAKVPEGVMNCVENKVACEAFWGRQSETAKKFILSFKGNDRNAALTCYAITGYKDITPIVRECTKSLIGDRRSLSYCEGKGFELMSAKMEKCQNGYRHKNDYPLPY